MGAFIVIYTKAKLQWVNLNRKKEIDEVQITSIFSGKINLSSVCYDVW